MLLSNCLVNDDWIRKEARVISPSLLCMSELAF
jgi:hypothetical protein